MSWILLVIISHICWSVENVFTKIVIGSKIKNPYVFLILISILSILVLPFINVKYIFLPSAITAGWLFLASLLYTTAGIPYVKAMEIEEVTRINILWNTIPVFSLILSWAIIGDRLSGIEFVAMFFLLTGAILASIKKGSMSLKMSPAFWLMILSCLLYAAYALVVRYLSKSLAFSSIFFWVIVIDAISINIAFVFKKIRKDFIATISNNKISFIFWFLIIVLISNFGLFLNQWALSLKPGALIYSFEGIQVLMVFSIAVFIAKFYPGALEESVDKKNLLIKFFAFIMIMVGIVLLTF